jgi:Zn-dependent protease with chaperone function
MASAAAWILLVVAPLHRWCEFHADRFAILDEAGIPSPDRRDDYASALARLAMCNPGSYSRGTLFHPPIRERLQRVLEIS